MIQPGLLPLLPRSTRVCRKLACVVVVESTAVLNGLPPALPSSQGSR